MNNDNRTQPELHRLTPRGTGPELRDRVLAAVGRELQPERGSPWPRRLAVAAAASLLLGVGLNVWVNKSADRRMALLYGPRPVPKRIADVADTVASVTDPETGRLIRQRLAAIWWSRPTGSPQGISSSSVILNRPESAGKEQRHEHPEKARDRPGDGDRDTSDCQRGLGPDHRETA